MAESVSNKPPLNRGLSDSIGDDSQLIEEAKKDPARFADLYRKYVDSIYHYLLARVGNEREAEDLTAEVFLQALEGLENYHHRGHFAAWLFTIARRRVADHYRGQPRELSAYGFDNIPEQENNLLEDLIQQQELESLENVVSSLPEEQQELLRLRCAAGLTFREIAGVLEHSESAVKMSYYRLLDRLEMLLTLE